MPSPPGNPGAAVSGGQQRSQRRPHRKSRNGCRQCKQAKIKCDEGKPSCGHCRRYQSRCSFLDPLSAASSISSPRARTSQERSPLPGPGAGSPSTASNVSEGLPPSISAALEVNNLELLHHYTTETSLTLSSRADLQQIWQKVVPQIAFTHHFLLHGLLAFSALHLARSQPARKAALYAEASAHHSIGLKMFQAAMSSVTRGNCDACFAFSSLIASYTWASSDQTADLFFSDGPSSKEKSSVEWVSLVRGVHTLMKASGAWIMSGPMGPMLEARHMEPELVREVDPEGSAKLEALSRLWSPPPEKLDADEVQALGETLALLHESCGLAASASADHEIDVILVVLSWPVQVSEAFLAMVKEQKPEALVVLAHFSLLLNKVDQLWYMRGMSRRLLRIIHSKVGKEWESWIAWPLQSLVLSEFQD